MKRIHLFEFEDQSWFPSWLRTCITKMIIPIHRLLGTSQSIAEILVPPLRSSGLNRIIDLCSGSTGPMIEVFKEIKSREGMEELTLSLTDLYPDQKLANSDLGKGIQYHPESIDATDIPKTLNGFRTIICGFHHMKPDVAKSILASAQKDKSPILIFEISDNSPPILLSFLALPINVVMGFIVSAFVRPFTWQQFLFTYLIPIIPLTFAWDGAISNMRTYTLSDLDELLQGFESKDYTWRKGIIKKKAKMIYLLGMPS